MRHKNRKNKRTQRNDDHADEGRRDLSKEFFNKDKSESSQDGREHLRLVANHLYLRNPKSQTGISVAPATA